MNTNTQRLLLVLLVIFCISATYAQNDMVIGSVSGKIEAGETYELYKSSVSSLWDYLSGWQYVGYVDRTIDYSYNQIYEKCLDEAKKQYGRYYSDLDVEDMHFDVKFESREDDTFYAQDFSGTEYKKKARRLKLYRYSATVITKE